MGQNQAIRAEANVKPTGVNFKPTCANVEPTGAAEEPTEDIEQARGAMEIPRAALEIPKWSTEKPSGSELGPKGPQGRSPLEQKEARAQGGQKEAQCTRTKSIGARKKPSEAFILVSSQGDLKL